MAKKIVDDAGLVTLVQGLIEECKSVNTEQSGKRRRAIDYYNGVMLDVPSEEGRSSIVTREVRSTIKKILPSIMRVVFGSDKLADYKPVGEGDEEGAESATLYVNNVVVPESGAEDAVYDAVHSALLLDEGVLTWWWEEKRRVSVTYHSGITAEELQVLEGDSDVEVLETEEYEDQLPDQTSIAFYRVRLKRNLTDRVVRISAVAVEDFGIHPDATSEDDAAICYQRMRRTRSDLIADGYDRDIIEALPAEQHSIKNETDVLARDNDVSFLSTGGTVDAPSLDMIEVYRCFVRVDMDGDGIAELREVHYVEGYQDAFLFNDYADEVRFAIVVAERVPHSPRGVSVFDDVQDLQRLNTVLTRQGLDNLYQHNNPQPIFADGDVVNPSSVTSPHFGEPIKMRKGAQPVTYNVVPFVADKSALMADRVKQEIVDRTGISSASSALDPNALQDVREQGVNMISDAASAQAWMMVRAMAKGGLRRMFRGVLRLVVQNQDKPRLVRLSDKWVSFDPRSWNADMDCTVNVGLGTGTRERDMQAVQLIAGMQRQILEGFGPANPLVDAEKLYNTLDESVKAAGLVVTDKFFNRPQPGQGLQPPQQGPSLEQVKLQNRMALEQQKMAAQRDKEAAQAEADIAVKQAEMAKEERQFALDAERQRIDNEFKREIEREKIASAERIAAAKLQHDLLLEQMRNGVDTLAVDAATGEVGPSALMQHVMAQTEMLRALQQTLAAPKQVSFVKDEFGNNIGGTVQSVMPSEAIN